MSTQIIEPDILAMVLSLIILLCDPGQVTSLYFSFLIYKTGIMIVVVKEGCYD